MKTAGRHHANHPRPRYKSATNDAVIKPDRIIMPIQATEGPHDRVYRGKVVSFEYTDFEEIEAGSSTDYDEAAFQEFATDDPTRLRVADKANHG
jgi:hypothetical protein